MTEELLKDLKEVLEKHDASIEYDIRDKEIQVFDVFGNYESFRDEIDPYLIDLKLKAKKS